MFFKLKLLIEQQAKFIHHDFMSELSIHFATQNT